MKEMTMFNPVNKPKYKKNWPGHWLSLDATYPQGRVNAHLVYIARRKNAMDTMHSSHDVSRWGSIRILAVSWQCSECGAYHSGYLPESLIDEGKAVFLINTPNPKGDHNDQG
jgi:hypothetical protein